MPSRSRKTHERRLAKLAARRAAERRRRRRQRLIATGVGVVLVLGLIGGLGTVLLTGGKKKTTAESSPTPTPTPPASPGSNCGYHTLQEETGKKGPVPLPTFSIDVAKTYRATLLTSLGTIKLQLFSKEAPCAVNSFVYLAKRKFYNGLTFHRIVRDSVIQGGDPTGTGGGGPGYQFNDELNNSLRYQVGTLGMANSGPNTNGSQFFIVAGKRGTTLPKRYTIFGKVVSGLAVVAKIDSVPTKGEAPKRKVLIEKITIRVS